MIAKRYVVLGAAIAAFLTTSSLYVWLEHWKRTHTVYVQVVRTVSVPVEEPEL